MFENSLILIRIKRLDGLTVEVLNWFCNLFSWVPTSIVSSAVRLFSARMFFAAKMLEFNQSKDTSQLRIREQRFSTSKEHLAHQAAVL